MPRVAGEGGLKIQAQRFVSGACGLHPDNRPSFR